MIETNKVLFEVSSLVVFIVEFDVVVLLLVVTIKFVVLIISLFIVVVCTLNCFATKIYKFFFKFYGSIVIKLKKTKRNKYLKQI